MLRPSPDVEELARVLKQLRVHAGNPPLKRLTSAQYSISTISRALSGQRCPTWGVTSSIAVACGVGEGSRQYLELIRLWERARTNDEPRSSKLVPVVADDAAACPRCGALVADEQVHASWHEGVDALVIHGRKPRRRYRSRKGDDQPETTV